MQYNVYMDTIKILQLNVWTGRIKGALRNFFTNNRFDVICLQEAIWADSDHNDILESFGVTVDQIKAITGLEYDSRASNWSVNALGTEVQQGNAIISRFKITNETIETVHGNYKIATTRQDLLNHCYKAQLITLENGLSVLNYHGYWLTDPMGDNTTVEVMHKVANLARQVTSPLVMCGDLNVVYDSPAMRELDFLTDLTHEHGINNTLAGLNFAGEVACDHILINDQVTPQSFTVLDEIVSDHKPLLATIKL